MQVQAEGVDAAAARRPSRHCDGVLRGLHEGRSCRGEDNQLCTCADGQGGDVRVKGPGAAYPQVAGGGGLARRRAERSRGGQRRAARPPQQDLEPALSLPCAQLVRDVEQGRLCSAVAVGRAADGEVEDGPGAAEGRARRGAPIRCAGDATRCGHQPQHLRQAGHLPGARPRGFRALHNHVRPRVPSEQHLRPSDAEQVLRRQPLLAAAQPQRVRPEGGVARRRRSGPRHRRPQPARHPAAPTAHRDAQHVAGVPALCTVPSELRRALCARGGVGEAHPRVRVARVPFSGRDPQHAHRVHPRGAVEDVPRPRRAGRAGARQGALSAVPDRRRAASCHPQVYFT
eukprot:PhM_4_TR9568/c0_g10_i1/m.38157